MPNPSTGQVTVNMTPDQMEDLRSALSCSFAADLAEELSEAFLHHLVDQLPPSLVGMAAEWNWNDTEVREKVCAEAARLLGVVDPQGDRTLRTQSPEAYDDARKEFIAAARAAHAAWLRNQQGTSRA